MNDEKLPTNLERVFERLDDDCDALKPFFIEEISADLKRRGVDTASTTEAIMKLLKQAKAIHQSQALPEQPSIVERCAEKVAEKIRRYRDLLFFEPQFAAGGNLAGAALVEADKPREIVLAKEFTESELSRIPWVGPKLKLSKTIDAEKGTAIYHAFVTSINKHAPQTGTLRIVLIAPDGQTAEACLKSNDQKKMFQGVDLPADSSGLRYAILIE